METIFCFGSKCKSCRKTNYKQTPKVAKSKLGFFHSRWLSLQARCHYKNSTGYKNYGGRGIQNRFKHWKDLQKELGPAPFKGASIDRIDNNGHYETGNVKWADYSQQARNRRNNKLTAEKVKELRKKLNENFPQKKLAKEYKISIQTINQIKFNKTWVNI